MTVVALAENGIWVNAVTVVVIETDVFAKIKISRYVWMLSRVSR
jgi:hypothetical protein